MKVSSSSFSDDVDSPILLIIDRKNFGHLVETAKLVLETVKKAEEPLKSYVMELAEIWLMYARSVAPSLRTPSKVDRDQYNEIFTLGRSYGYTWRRYGDDQYQTVRSDGTVQVTFGPPHPDDVEYFNGLCSKSDESP